MTQTFSADERVSVTLVKVTPNIVTQVKNQDKDGYVAIQLGIGNKKRKTTTKPLQGHLTSSMGGGSETQGTLPKFLREVKTTESDLKQGNQVKVTDVLSVGDMVTVTGISKGKGFAGGVKRWGFAGGPKTHGQSDRHRAPGSIGQGTTPGRVYKGKHMAGRMGSDTKTIKNLQIVEINKEDDMIMIKGAIPGTVGSLVRIVRVGDISKAWHPSVVKNPEVKESQNA